MATRVAIALGSNLGDRRAHLDYAVSRLDGLLEEIQVSSYIETAPVGVPGHQGPFLNAAVVGDTVLPARALLTRLLAIEADRRRERPFPGAARTLDLDLILFADRIIDEVGLVVPHPRFRSRQFVLEPLAEVAPKMIDPVTGKTVRELLNVLTDGGPGRP
jgi:2-amino-4-hydroxy-6-hydroxymethyldihydropteridine diphosphokinase